MEAGSTYLERSNVGAMIGFPTGPGGLIGAARPATHESPARALYVTFITRFRLPLEVDGDLRLYFSRHPVFYPGLITPFFNRFQYRATE